MCENINAEVDCFISNKCYQWFGILVDIKAIMEYDNYF